MTRLNIKGLQLQELLGPLLPSLPPAAFSTHPSENVLPLLSPILRQRVQLLSTSSTEPWIRLLCYDTAKVPRLMEIAQSASLEPHPVSGEVEVDWDYDTETRYRRLDEETLQTLVVLKEMGLSFQLVYCTGDVEGDGWKVGEVSVADTTSPFESFGGVSTIEEADRQFKDLQSKKTSAISMNPKDSSQLAPEDDDHDDDYWARYDATPARTPARTPAAKQSPAPRSIQGHNTAAEEDYYAQYDSVQPALDPHDPDEEVDLPDVPPPLGLGTRPGKPTMNGNSEEELELNETNGAWTLAEPPRSSSPNSRSGDDPNIAHPRPASPSSSSASVAKLEAAAENFGVQQHISRSIKSLFMLGRASGMDREEFERIVRTELDMLGLMED